MNDIKKLEKLVEHKNDYDLAFGTKIHRPYVMYDEDWEVLEDIIVRIKDLEQIEKEHKEENGRLREENKKLQEFYEKYYDSINSELNGLLTHKFIGYIPISKIKEKIEELTKIKGDLATYIATSERIKVLQELLEESEK